MPNGSTLVRALWESFEARDFKSAAELLHDDFTCDWPQTRERIRGRNNFIALNKNYPGDWHIRIIRIVTEGNQVASEVHVAIDGRLEPAASFFEMRDGKLWRLTEYWPDSYEPPTWRKQWVELY